MGARGTSAKCIGRKHEPVVMFDCLGSNEPRLVFDYLGSNKLNKNTIFGFKA